MGQARKKRKRRGYMPRKVYDELHLYGALFLETLTPEEQEIFMRHAADGLTPKERRQAEREDPTPDDLLLKFKNFLEKQDLSKEFLRYFHIKSSEEVATT